MQKTILNVVKDILSDIDSDAIVSLDDTNEARQIATIVKNEYNRMVSEHYSVATPSLLRITEAAGQYAFPLPRDINVYKVQLIDTVVDNKVHTLKFQPLDEFISEGTSKALDGITAYSDGFYRTRPNLIPTRWTVSKSPTGVSGVGKGEPHLELNGNDQFNVNILLVHCESAFTEIGDTITDSTSFQINTSDYPLLYNEIKAVVYSDLRQEINQKTEKKLRQEKVRAEKRASDRKRYTEIDTRNFGRK